MIYLPSYILWFSRGVFAKKNCKGKPACFSNKHIEILPPFEQEILPSISVGIGLYIIKTIRGGEELGCCWKNNEKNIIKR